MIIPINKKVLRNLISILSIDVLVKAGNIILMPLYLKLMLPEEFGMYTYVLGIATFFASVGGFGLYGVLNRYFYDKKYKRPEVVSTVLILLFIFIIGFMLLCLGTKDLWINYLFASKISVFIVYLMIFASLHSVMIQFIMGFFYIKKEYKKIQVFNVSRLIVVNSLSLFILYYFSIDATIERLSGLVISELLVSCFFLRYVLKFFSFKKFNTHLALVSVKFGYPLALNAILGFIYTFADKYFIQNKFGFSAVGEYVFIFAFASLFGLIFSAIQNFWLPFFFNPKNKDIIEKKLLYLILVLAGLVVVYYGIVLIALEVLFYFEIFDTVYESGIEYLWLLVFAQFFTATRSLYNNYYALYNKTLNGLYVSLIMSIISLVVMYLFVSRYQVYGVAIAVLINSVIGLYLTILFVRRLRRKNFA